MTWIGVSESWFFSCPGLPSARAPSIRCALASLRSRFVAPCDGAPAPGRIFPPRGSRSCGGGEPRSREAATAPAPPGPRSGRSDSARIGPAALRTLRGPAGGMDSSRYSSPLSPPSPSGRSRPSTQASTALAVPIAWAASAGSNSSRGGGHTFKRRGTARSPRSEPPGTVSRFRWRC